MSVSLCFPLVRVCVWNFGGRGQTISGLSATMAASSSASGLSVVSVVNRLRFLLSLFPHDMDYATMKAYVDRCIAEKKMADFQLDLVMARVLSDDLNALTSRGESAATPNKST